MPMTDGGTLRWDISVYRPSNVVNQPPYMAAPPSPDLYSSDILLVHEKTGEWVRLGYALA